jgi:hypothetical protein
LSTLPETVLPYAVVAFLDFLGFRAMVQADAGIDGPVYLPLILEALDRVERSVNEAGLEISQFSDSIVVSSPFEPERVAHLVAIVCDLQRLLVERGIAIRGGIAFGRHYAQDGRLFSQALVTAYELESRRARFPRVLVDPNLLDWLLNHPDARKTDTDSVRANLMKDRDGELFLHYLDDGLISSHTSLIRSALRLGEDGDAGVLSKAHWLVDYHEYMANELGEGALDAGIAARFQHFE